MKKTINELFDFCVINVDKPANCTSHDVVAKIKKIFNAKKAGHCGTLDPMVTGVLPILLNKATRLSDYFMKKEKIYVGKMLLHKEINKEKLEEEMRKFLGKIMQKPPVKSRVKRVLRQREIMDFRILKMNKKVVEFESRVEAGTYIRKLISDLGEKIGGAHMTELKRIKAGIFEINNSYKIEEIEQAVKELKESNNEEKLRKMLIPAEIIEKIIPRINVKEESVKSLLNGKPLMKKDFDKEIKSDRFCIFFKDRFIGVYKIVSSLDKPNEALKNAEQGSDNLIIGRAEFVKN